MLDPVDGTRAFITGRHEWGSLIALEDEGRAVLGVLDQPVLRERFVGAVGHPAVLHQAGGTVALKVRACEKISDAVLCATSPVDYFTPDERAALRRVRAEVRMSRWGGDCYIFGALALGFVDVIVESYFKRWDVAALIPLVEAAGGVITNWQGGSCAQGGQVLATGDARMHDVVLKLLNG